MVALYFSLLYFFTISVTFNHSNLVLARVDWLMACLKKQYVVVISKCLVDKKSTVFLFESIAFLCNAHLKLVM